MDCWRRDAAPGLGSEVHADLEAYHRGNVWPARHNDIINAYIETVANVYFDQSAEPRVEECFASPLGYGGRVDLITRTVDGLPLLLDWKTQATTPGKPVAVWEDWLPQLAAYKRGLELPEETVLANVVLSTTERGRVEYIPHQPKEEEAAWEYFCNCFQVWKHLNNYNPGPDLRTVETTRVHEATETPVPTAGVTAGQVARLAQMARGDWRITIDSGEEPPARVGDMVAVARLQA